MLRVAAPLRVRLWCGAPAEPGQRVHLDAGALRLAESGAPLLDAPGAVPQRGIHAQLVAAWKARLLRRALPARHALP